VSTIGMRGITTLQLGPKIGSRKQLIRREVAVVENRGASTEQLRS